MWHPPPITKDNLRLIIQEAPAGSKIVVPRGEFEGPFIFDRPVHLVGQGDQPEAVTLWTRRGPAVIVRSAGVSLTNLGVVLTFEEAHQEDATLWYATGCQPDTQGTQIEGRLEQMKTSNSNSAWILPDLIDLGDLQARYPVTLPMVIHVPGPARLDGRVSGVHVEPTRLPAAGKHQIQVYVPQDMLQLKDTMLAGQLIIESEGESRTVWIIGRVLEDEFKSWVRDNIVLLGRKGHRFGFVSTVLLGKEQLQDEPGADHLAEKQAYIIKEASGVWSIIQPLPVNLPTKVNGQPLGIGRRLVLKGKEVIEIGTLKLSVEDKKTDLPVKVEGNVDFGKLSIAGTITPYPSIKIQNNHKRKNWTGTLHSTVPWIQVPQPQLLCPGGQIVQVSVQLSPDVNNLPPQTQMFEYGALILKGPKESWFINAQLEVDIKEGLDIEPDTLDFGRVSDFATIAAQQLRLRNVGTVDWQGTVQAVPWLVIDNPTLQCAAGAEISLEIRLTEQVADLPEGPNAVSEALKIEGPDRTITVAARLHFDKPKVDLDLKPRHLTWGKIMDWRTAKSKMVKLHNTGLKDWQGKVKSTVPWLEVVPTTLKCPAQGQDKFTVRLTNQFQSLAAGEQKIPTAIQIEGEGQKFSLPVRLIVEVPRIRPDTTLIKLTLSDDSNLRHYALQLQNNGGQDWHGKVKSTLPWLVINPTNVTCPAGGKVAINVTLELNQINKIFNKPRLVKVDDAIQIEGGGQPLLVGMHLDIKKLIEPLPGTRVIKQPLARSDQKEQAKIEATSSLLVDFGIVSDESGKLPTREVRLTNSQPWVMNGTVHSTLPWLEVTPTNFSCPPEQEVVLTVKLTQAIAQLRPKAYNVADALVIKSDSKKHLVNARVEVAQKTVVKTGKPSPQVQKVQPSALMVDFGTISDISKPLPTREVRLVNSQTQEMKGTVRSTLPWLEVTPVNFSCPSKQELKLIVKLAQAATRLRPRAYDVPDALVIESENKKILVRAQLEVTGVSPRMQRSGALLPEKEKEKTASPSSLTMETSPSTGLMVDFGQVSDWSGQLPEREIRLTNSSQTQVMNGTVRSTLPWLEVTPSSFSCPAGQEVKLTIKLTQAGAGLRPKTYAVADALIIKSGDKKHLIKAHLLVVKGLFFGGAKTSASAQPAKTQVSKETKAVKKKASSKVQAQTLLVNPSSIDFGMVSNWKNPLPTQTIELINGLKTDWQGTVQSTLPWLEVEPLEITCAAGDTVKLQVRLTSYGSRLRPRTYSVSDALIIEGDSQKLLIEAQLKVNRSL